MQSQNNVWISILFITMLSQDSLLTIVNTKNVTMKKQTTSSYEACQDPNISIKCGKEGKMKIKQSQKNAEIRLDTKPFWPFSSSSDKNTSNGVQQQINSSGATVSKYCSYSQYRSYDGSYNNLQNPTWGMTDTIYERLLPPRYSDGIQAPSKSTINDSDLPSARKVSYTMFPNVDVDGKKWTLLAMQYGQIIAHDMGFVVVDFVSTKCCSSDGQMLYHSDPSCWPIPIPDEDPAYSKYSIRCMDFIRSPVTNRTCSSQNKPPCVEQLNAVSHYLDLSIAYGSNEDMATNLRTYFNGSLKVELKGKNQFPPQARNKTDMCGIIEEHEQCYTFGDARGNQSPQLAILQIMYIREHNRVADYLARLNPHWDDERIFQETRRIVIAEHQNIAYYEWLPIFLGEKHVYDNNIIHNTQNFVNDYDETVNPSVLNEHSHAALRYFHTNIAGYLDLRSTNRCPFDDLRLSEHYFKPGIIEKDDCLNGLTMGFAHQPLKSADVYYDKEITQFLFKDIRGKKTEDKNRLGLDLRATDIQRDRDHGLASYNDYREYFGLPRARTFNDFRDYISVSNVRKLSKLYASPNDVELTVGGSLEKPVNGALVGPMFLRIILKQFQRTRIGDRYWFETGDPKIGFTIEQLNELRKSSISRLLCDNGDKIQHMQRFGFQQISIWNSLKKCNKLPQINLSFWKCNN